VEEARRDAGVSGEDVEVIRTVNDAVSARDIDTISGRLHPDVVWEHNIGQGSPEEGIYRGREDVIALLERILEVWEYMRTEPRIINDLGGGEYEIRGELRAKHASSTSELVQPYEQHFEFHDGLLVRAKMRAGAGVGETL
jgi:ketosteroid isomerase-like protein